MRTNVRFVSLSALSASLILTTAGLAATQPSENSPARATVAAQQEPSGSKTPHSGVNPLTALSASFEQLASTTSRAVVQVNVTGYAIVPNAGQDEVAALAKEKGVGSGVILSPDGYIVTNAHVVRNAQKVTVHLHQNDNAIVADDATSAIPATVVGVDTDTDLAVIKVDRDGLPFLTLGNSDQVRQGQLVIAFGSPLGLTNSMTMGMVSAPTRQLSPEDFMQYIQTDAAINPGNSGGPLVDSDGKLIGINTMILSQSGGNEGVGLAIPSNLVHTIVKQLKAEGRVRRGMIGVDAETITPTLSEGLHLPQAGALVNDLMTGGPAEGAGLHIGDVILKVNDMAVHTAPQLQLAVFQTTPGDTVRLLVNSMGEEKTITVPVHERPDSQEETKTLSNPKQSLLPELGILGMTLDQGMAREMQGLREQNGVFVAAEAHEPTAWTSSLQPGDIIHEINGSAVVNFEFLRDKLAALQPGTAVVLQVERAGVLRYLAFRAE